MNDQDSTALITAQQEQITSLGNYIGQLAAVVGILREEMEQMKKDNERRVTVNHQQALMLQGLIRERAEQICIKYHLDPVKHRAAFRTALKKATLSGWGIADLHDLPLICYDAAASFIRSWTSYTLVNKRRRIDEQN